LGILEADRASREAAQGAAEPKVIAISLNLHRLHFVLDGQSQVAPELEPLLRAALQLLAPPAPTYAPTQRRERPDDGAAGETGA
jgi:hypothetical protein